MTTLVYDLYCMECFAPSGRSDYCPRHAYLSVKRCQFCNDRAVVNDAGLLHCLKAECMRKAAEW